jgi:Protein of unknown function (DUF5672)
MKLNLPNVTLVCCETRNHALMRLAIEDCVRACEFGGIVIATDRPLEFAEFNYLRPKIVAVPDWTDKLGWCRWIWFGAPPHVRTSQMLLVQWDAGVWDTSMWRDEFMDYDYIGSPWEFHPTKKVGNSGFALKSARLARYMADHAWEFPCDSTSEDYLLCRTYRPKLEERGFRWAPTRLAHEFAFECSRPSTTSRHFGFHAAFNFGIVLDHDRLLERARLMMASPMIADSYIMRAFCEINPDVIRELQNEQESVDARDLSLSRKGDA